MLAFKGVDIRAAAGCRTNGWEGLSSVIENALLESAVYWTVKFCTSTGLMLPSAGLPFLDARWTFARML